MSHACVMVAITGSTITNEEEIEKKVTEQMLPFYESEAWFQDGSRWDWWQIGGRYSGLFIEDVQYKKDINLEELKSHLRKRRLEWWNTRSKAFDSSDGITPEMTFEDYHKKQGEVPVPYAFLKDRVWSEKGRLGWFGSDAKSECEIQNMNGVCSFEKDGAKIITYGAESSWTESFWDTFIKPLPDDTILVTVDYHV